MSSFDTWRMLLEADAKKRLEQKMKAARDLQRGYTGLYGSSGHRGTVGPTGPSSHERVELPLSFQTEPVVGHRLWQVLDFETRAGKEPRLAPIATSGGGFYPPMHRMEAFCVHGHHEAPWRGCHCGVWALKEAGSLERAAHNYHAHAAWGEIYLWGRIIEASIGYRAQYAYPKRLYTYKPELVDALATLYGVPVELAKPLSSPSPFAEIIGTHGTTFQIAPAWTTSIGNNTYHQPNVWYTWNSSTSSTGTP